MRRRGIILFLLLAGMTAGSEGGAAAPPSIDLRGSPQEARQIAERTARAWVRAPGARRLEDLASSVGSALVAAGWGEGTIEARIDTIEGRPVYTIRLHEIAPAQLASWVWDPPCEIPPPPTGIWDPGRASEEIDAGLSAIQETGRPFASIQILAARDSSGGMAVRARLQKGAPVRLASPVFEGRGPTRPSYLARVSGLRRGDPIRPATARLARDRIERTGLFSQVDGPWLRVLQGDQADLIYRLTPLPQNRIEGAVGYDGRQRALSGYVQVELGNLFGTGRSFATSWNHYRRDRSALDLSYREPFIAGLPVAGAIALSQQIEDTTWTADEARGQLEGDLGGGLVVRLGLAGHRTIQRGAFAGRYRRVDTIAGFDIDRRRDAGTAGSRVDMEIARGSVKRTPRLAEGEGTLVRVALTSEANRALGRHGHLHAELIAAAVEGPDSLPRPDALTLGGAASLRGYPEDAFRTLRQALLRVELGVRILPEGNRAYLFSDEAVLRPWPAGAVLRRSSYGFGVRIRGAGGWIRLDYGIPGGNGPLAGRIHFRLESRF